MVKEIIANSLEILTLLSGITVVLILAGFAYSKISGKKYEWFNKIIKENYFLFGLLVSLAATLGSLFYSEIAGFQPCILCWYQRIFMYPQVLLFAVALWKKDRKVVRYSLTFSLIGLLIGGYHYFTQIGILSGACEVVGYSTSCSDTFFLAFGYITIPMMAFTAFALLLILNYNFLKK